MSGFGCDFFLEYQVDPQYYSDQSHHHHQIGYGSCSVLPSAGLICSSYFSPPPVTSPPPAKIDSFLPPLPADYQWPATCSNVGVESSQVFVQPVEMRDSRKRRTEEQCAAAAEDNRDNVAVFLDDDSRGTVSIKKKKGAEQPIDMIRPFKTSDSSFTPGVAAVRRSQKLSDKITALQKVVSPYGKTDTASVLQETCMYIKIAHQEIRRLSISYYGVIRSLQQYHHQFSAMVHHNDNNSKAVVGKQHYHEKPLLDLKSKGLCLVPLSMTKLLLLTDQDSTAAGDNYTVASSSSRRF